jgi:hypothetical protein
VIADFQLLDFAADLLDHAGKLVAERHARARVGTGAVIKVKI